jgi:hypothetical protein
VPRILLLLLVTACAKNSNDPYGGKAMVELVDTEAKGDSLAYYQSGFAVRMSDEWKTNKTIPDGIRRRLNDGNVWIVLKEPVVFAAASLWIVRGATPFLPDEISLKAAHDRRDDELGRNPPLRPALLVLRGHLPSETSAGQLYIDRLKDLDIEKLGLSHGIKAVESETDRVALGRGVETAMQIATGRVGDGVGQSSYDWVTTYKDGKPVADAEWIAAIDKSAEERRPYHAIIRRYRPSVEPRETWFSVPLNVVLLCSQMRLEKPQGGKIPWEWEGFWLGRLTKVASTPQEVGSPPVRVVYAEYKSDKKQRRGGDYLSSVFDPVTRTGKTALEELKRRGVDAFSPTAD